VAGKTGTTSSNKDGWFIGFSSGITTGVWMGRDDARAVAGLQGGTAPARAFAAYMRYAVRDRPVEPFDTDLKLPEWQLEPDDEAMFGDPEDWYFVDEQGNLIEPSAGDDGQPPFDQEGEQRPGASPAPPAASDDFLDRATGRRAAPPTPRPSRSPPPGAGGPVDAIINRGGP
jgi:penicillin-binding protein 1A